MSQPQPYPPPALLYLHGNTCHGPRFWCRRYLLVKVRRLASGLLSPPLDPLFGAPKSDPSKNREMGGALALGGRRSLMKNNNQLGVCVRSGRDVQEEARGWESVWGDTVQYFGATIQNMKFFYVKYTVAFGWPPIDNNSHNNQTIICFHNRGKCGGEVQRAGGAWGI